MKKVLLLLAAAISLRSAAQINTGKQLTPDGYYEIPLTETLREIRTKVNLRGDEYDFMLDTGAPAFISSELQKKYKFKVLLKTKMEDASGNLVKTQIVLIDTIRIGSFVFTGIPALVIDMKNSPLECLNMSGNFGSNMLRHLYVQFDRQAQHVALAAKKEQLRKQPALMHRALLSGQSDVFFAVKLNNELTDTVHYDSGDGMFYSMSKQTMTRFCATYPSQQVRKGFGALYMGVGGAGDNVPQYEVKPAGISVGSSSISGGYAAIAQNSRSRMGRELLNYGVLQLNYPDTTYGFEAYTPAYQPAPFDYGFQLLMDDDKLIAGCVWDNSQAAKQGMTTGDRIVRINDFDITATSKCEIAELTRSIRQHGNPTLKVTYQHGKQEPKTITLERADL